MENPITLSGGGEEVPLQINNSNCFRILLLIFFSFALIIRRNLRRKFGDVNVKRGKLSVKAEFSNSLSPRRS